MRPWEPGTRVFPRETLRIGNARHRRRPPRFGAAGRDLPPEYRSQPPTGTRTKNEELRMELRTQNPERKTERGTERRTERMDADRGGLSWVGSPFPGVLAFCSSF